MCPTLLLRRRREDQGRAGCTLDKGLGCTLGKAELGSQVRCAVPKHPLAPTACHTPLSPSPSKRKGAGKPTALGGSLPGRRLSPAPAAPPPRGGKKIKNFFDRAWTERSSFWAIRPSASKRKLDLQSRTAFREFSYQHETRNEFACFACGKFLRGMALDTKLLSLTVSPLDALGLLCADQANPRLLFSPNQ